jgi:hypothetical protein
MKKVIVMCIMLVASFTFAKAQQGGGGFQNMSAEDLAKRMDDRLAEVITGLTADQKAKLKVVNLDLAKQQVEARQKNQGNMDGMRAANQKIEETREAKFKEILTAAQLKQYTDDRAQRQQRQGQGRRNN